MYSKSLLIAIAAFAVTATGAQAYVSTKYANQTGLSSHQIQAFNQARDQRRKGEDEQARDILLEAGVSEETIVSLRSAKTLHVAIHEALAADDFATFKKVVERTPLNDLITNEEDFALFKEAHERKLEGNYEDAEDILEELGISGNREGDYQQQKPADYRRLKLSFDHFDAWNVAKEANNKQIMEEILKEAGLSDRFEKIELNKLNRRDGEEN